MPTIPIFCCQPIPPIPAFPNEVTFLMIIKMASPQPPPLPPPQPPPPLSLLTTNYHHSFAELSLQSPFAFESLCFRTASPRIATLRIASVRIASLRNASLQIEKPTLRQRSSKCRGRLVETHARMHHRFLAVRVLREVRSSCELPS